MSTHEDFTRKQDLKGPSDRSFGWVFAGFFAIVGAWPAVHGKPLRMWALGVALAIAAVTLVRPSVLHRANVLWMKFGLLLGRIVNPIVTGLVFYLVVTPTALIMKMMGKRPLPLGFDGNAQSYWIERRPPGPKPETMSQQF